MLSCSQHLHSGHQSHCLLAHFRDECRPSIGSNHACCPPSWEYLIVVELHKGSCCVISYCPQLPTLRELIRARHQILLPGICLMHHECVHNPNLSWIVC